jgi:hypothetical protein
VKIQRLLIHGSMSYERPKNSGESRMKISITLMKLALLWDLLQQLRWFLELKCLVNHG